MSYTISKIRDKGEIKMVALLTGVKTLGKATVIVDIVAKGNSEIRPEFFMNPSKVAIHNTGNSGRGANAKSHNTYIHNMAKLPESATGYASWHFSVDENFIYQHLPLSESAWHTGDGSGSKSGNRTAIGIEICEHVDQKNYAQAEENAVALTVWLLKNCGITVDNVKPHQYFSGKYCPRVILKRDGGFSKFHARVKNAYAIKPKPVVTKVESIVKPKSHTIKSGDTFNGLAKEYGFTVDFIVQCNPRVNPSKLQVGDVIHFIPVTLTVPKPVPVPVSKPVPVPVPKPVVRPKPVVPSIKRVGTIRIVNVANACYVLDKPSSKGKVLGMAKSGERLAISGSVSGWFEVIYKDKRAYVNDKFGNLM